MSRKRYCYNCSYYARVHRGRCVKCGTWFLTERTLVVVLCVGAVLLVLATMNFLTR